MASPHRWAHPLKTTRLRAPLPAWSACQAASVSLGEAGLQQDDRHFALPAPARAGHGVSGSQPVCPPGYARGSCCIGYRSRAAHERALWRAKLAVELPRHRRPVVAQAALAACHRRRAPAGGAWPRAAHLAATPADGLNRWRRWTYGRYAKSCPIWKKVTTRLEIPVLARQPRARQQSPGRPITLWRGAGSGPGALAQRRARTIEIAGPGGYRQAVFARRRRTPVLSATLASHEDDRAPAGSALPAGIFGVGATATAGEGPTALPRARPTIQPRARPPPPTTAGLTG